MQQGVVWIAYKPLFIVTCNLRGLFAMGFRRKIRLLTRSCPSLHPEEIWVLCGLGVNDRGRDRSGSLVSTCSMIGATPAFTSSLGQV